MRVYKHIDVTHKAGEIMKRKILATVAGITIGMDSMQITHLSTSRA
ncbi:hypothetical protein [Arcanobacterium ihumii]|nr:hypothetical protein [Arcanobacterium ihumii]